MQINAELVRLSKGSYSRKAVAKYLECSVQSDVLPRETSNHFSGKHGSVEAPHF